MKDIDFDELDRAVSSLMGAVPKDGDKPEAKASDAGGASTGKDQESTETSLSQPDSKPSRRSLQSRSVHSSQPSVAAKRGRYMDVVRPTGDIQSVPMVTPRKGRVTIEPQSLDVADKQKDEVQPLEEKPATPSTSSVPDIMPDPIDQLIDTMEKDGSLELDSDPAPLISPFLPDAKVEKRPLGRSADESAEAMPAVDTSPAEPEPMPADLMPEEPGSSEGAVDIEVSSDGSVSNSRNAQLPEQPLPAELGSEILNIESSMNSLLEDEEPATPKPASETPSEPKKSVAAATSIPQQYKIKPKAEEEPSGTIYDTSDYHQPIAHPQEEKSSWWWVLGIMFVAIAGIAGGVSLYYFWYH